MTYRELFYKATRLFSSNKMTLGEYDEMTKPLDREIEPCEDAISRQAVLTTLDNMDKVLDVDRTVENYKELLKECYKELTPVQPKSKTGHWIRITPSEIYECSECNQNVMTSDICAYKFCHGCGAKMESEDKEC